MSNQNPDDGEEKCIYIESDADFVDYCRELAIKQGRVQRRGNLATNDEGKYLGEVTYWPVLN